MWDLEISMRCSARFVFMLVLGSCRAGYRLEDINGVGYGGADGLRVLLKSLVCQVAAFIEPMSHFGVIFSKTIYI